MHTDPPDKDADISLEGALARSGAELNSTRYRIDKEIGRGAMGEVLQVFDPGLRRKLAMKVLRAEEASGIQPIALARFLEEAQVTAQLDHPGVVPVHEVGQDEQKRLYFTMRLVKGRDFRTIIDLARRGEEGWSPTGAVGVLLKVCEAMAYAHDKGVVHRDLKPANVMVGKYGEVYVMDWGLAQVAGQEALRDLHLRPPGAKTISNIRTDRGELRDVEDSPLVTMDGTILGTPYYMPPEQAAGRIQEIGLRSDVYAVGAMLYHLISGHPPYHSAGDRSSVHTVVAMVMHGPPKPLSQVAPSATPELIAICERAMARAIEDRYATMGALADDLRAYLEGRVVRAYEAGAAAEFRKWVKRNRGTAGAIAAALLLAMAGLASSAFLQAKRRHEQLVLSQELAAKNTALETANLDLSHTRDAALESAERAGDEAKEAAREREAADRIVDFLVGLFEAPDPEKARGKEVTAADLLARGAAAIAHDDLDPLVKARLQDTMGRAYHSLGRYAEAEPLYKASLEAYTKLLGESDINTISMLNHLAINYQLLERYGEAEPLYRRALELSRQRFGEDADQTVTTLSNLASLLTMGSRFAQAEPMVMQVLEAMRRKYGDDHPETFSVLNNLLKIYLEQGRVADAEALARQCRDGLARSRGKDHPDTLVAANNLAFLILEQKRYDEAESIIEQTLEDAERVLGPEHAMTLALVHNLGRVYQEQGQADEALPLFERALAGRREAFGTEHRDTQSSMEWAARACLATGDLERAEELAREVLALTRPMMSSRTTRQALLDQILAARR